MKQLLPFTVGYETYALEVVAVQEIIENQTVYPFPGAPEIVAGAISFHGRIIPVIDLALLLNFPSGKIGRRLIVLINQHGPVVLGVDRVDPIINIEMGPENQMQNYAGRSYIKDVVNWRGKMVSLFDLDQLQIKLELLCT